MADLLKSGVDNDTQILINTHSPVFPEYFEPASLILCHKQDRQTVFSPYIHHMTNGGEIKSDMDEETPFTERIIRGDFDA